MNAKSIAFAVLLILGAAACQNDESQSPQVQPSSDFNNQRMNRIDVNINSDANTRKAGGVENWMASINESLEGTGIQLDKIESYGADGAGNTVFFNNRGNKQLGHDFVPGDPRRDWRTDISYATDGTEGATASGLSQEDTDGAIFRAMQTWGNVSCTEGLALTDLGVISLDLGFVQYLLGFGGVSGYLSDITHAGFLPKAFFDALAPDGGGFILGVTFTFVWTEDQDIDNNGKTDVAFREIYYNDAFPWNIDDNFDVETVALHEAGHGLSQGHFGKLFRSGSNGELHFAPRAVMNAGYTGIQTSIGKTDKAGHCSNWAEWPNN